MRDSKEMLAKINPEALESSKNPSFIIHRSQPERNRSQNLKR
jgi:hypothetical protein